MTTTVLPTVEDLSAQVAELEGEVVELQRVVEVLARHLVVTLPTALRADLEPFGLGD